MEGTHIFFIIVIIEIRHTSIQTIMPLSKAITAGAVARRTAKLNCPDVIVSENLLFLTDIANTRWHVRFT